MKTQQWLVGYGAVIRNHIGLVMAAGLIRGFFYDDVDLAEAEALRFSIRLARETGQDTIFWH